jgi:hypothetical protein
MRLASVQVRQQGDAYAFTRNRCHYLHRFCRDDDDRHDRRECRGLLQDGRGAERLCCSSSRASRGSLLQAGRRAERLRDALSPHERRSYREKARGLKRLEKFYRRAV